MFFLPLPNKGSEKFITTNYRFSLISRPGVAGVVVHLCD